MAGETSEEVRMATGSEVIRRFEEVLVQNLGDVGLFILHQQLHEMGLGPENFDPARSMELIAMIRDEFSKIIGYSVEKLEMDLKKVLRG